MPLTEHSQFAGYTVVRLLGAGGMGEVYLARHPRLPRYEALKILRTDVSADPDYQRRFNREADLAANLWHPHIVGVHDRGEFDGQLWIAMDYVSGTDLAALLRTRYHAGMPSGDAITIITAVAEALDYAHHRGLMHRDVKPANIMISGPDEAGGPRTLLSDFGIARALDDISGLTATNMAVGTPDYGAPEQLMGQPTDGRADQYALAATAYHLLVGQKLFPRPNSVAIISAHLTTPPPPPSARRPDLAPLDAAFARALAKNPADRFARCGDLAAALAENLHQSPTRAFLHGVLAPPTGPTAHPVPPSTPTPLDVAPFAPTHHAEPAATPPPSLPPRQLPARRRLGRRAAVIAALASAAALGITIVPNFTHRDHPPTPSIAQLQAGATQVGRSYLEALGRGDATAALAFSAHPPPPRPLLTTEVLRAQLNAAPITNISVRSAPSAPGDNPADVQYVILSATFGPTPSQARVAVHRTGSDWKLDTTTATINLGAPGTSNASLKAVALWGVPTNGVSPVTVFPGGLSISSTNRYIDITAPATAVLLDALSSTIEAPTIQPTAALNDTGLQAAKTAVDSFIHHCHRGGTPPPECLQAANNPTINGAGDFTNTTFTFDPATMAVAVQGKATYHGTSAAVPLYTLIADIIGTVDLTQDPPTFTRNVLR
ncbi:serine/threonine-protein kinase [Mycobacterium sp. Aquia_216]|uniref:serine/threonine-protein kinase n=1 Tax=Mycobacterium sp. Aquia_216 TaxID=2991729 RepID=UPI003FA3DC31